MRDPGLRSERRAELQVGMLVLLAIVAVVAGVAWVSGADIGGDRYRLHAVTAEAEQVSEGSRVFVRGVDVGTVDDVRLEGDRVVVTMEVSANVSLPVDSRARIRAAGFLGSQMVQLLPGSASARLGPGDTLRAMTSPDLQTVATDLGDQAEAVLSRTSRLLSDTTLDAVQTGARDLSTTMREVRGLVEEERAHLQEMIASLRRTAAALDGATSGPELERTVSRLDFPHRAAERFQRRAGCVKPVAGLDPGEDRRRGGLPRPPGQRHVPLCRRRRGHGEPAGGVGGDRASDS